MKTCKSCGVRLGVHNKTGFCVQHYRQCPQFIERQKAAWEKRLADPIAVEKMRQTMRVNCKTPAAFAARSARAKQEKIWERGHAALKANPDARQRANRNQSETKLAGIPREVRDDYRWLTQVKRMSAAEAREIVLAAHEAQMARFRREIMEARG